VVKTMLRVWLRPCENLFEMDRARKCRPWTSRTLLVRYLFQLPIYLIGEFKIAALTRRYVFVQWVHLTHYGTVASNAGPRHRSCWYGGRCAEHCESTYPNPSETF
jgi:hypothetical protein